MISRKLGRCLAAGAALAFSGRTAVARARAPLTRQLASRVIFIVGSSR